ncbi:unnamed protein product [Blepharisma stoltei]|uniref:Uncharacterized protein n=1 Tax=Blepharisma stoltei TaxID=1481888 RepID=A0AAU9JY38_9CILI|nr:unnamed protein product [Blepharisma stoltei]
MKLSDTLKQVIADYHEVIILPKLTRLHKIMHSKKFLINIINASPVEIQISELPEISYKLAEWLNRVHKSHEVKELSDIELFAHLLSGRLCEQPKNEAETQILIASIQAELKSLYVESVMNIIEDGMWYNLDYL